MSDGKDQERGKNPLTLSARPKLELKKTVDAGQVRQSFSHGRSKVVTVEVKKKRTFAAHEMGREEAKAQEDSHSGILTDEEKAHRMQALHEAMQEEARRRAEREQKERAEEKLRVEEAATKEETSGEEQKILESDMASSVDQEVSSEPLAEETKEAPQEKIVASSAKKEEVKEAAPDTPKTAAKKPETPKAANAPVAKLKGAEDEDSDDFEKGGKKGGSRGPATPHKPPAVKRAEPKRRTGKISVAQAFDEEEGQERGRSMASMRRARERERQKQLLLAKQAEKVFREVIIPETLTVQELANRMAERGGDVIKALMRMGMMVTINQPIDADTAELVVAEFGHNAKRVSESDIEIGLSGASDREEHLINRPPVVTVMGHVDHGKTSLLDALRETDVVSGEAGGITQHIGAYQVTLRSGAKITFIDTPGHAAFTAMRARGAKVTDIVILVVAADDGIMPQTIEAIRHSKAAGVPIVVAINKIDKPDANPSRVRQELVNHEVILEEFGGDVMAIEVSAKKRMNLEKLEEAILLQAEVLDLKANPDRSAQGVVVEAKMEKGRGSIATVLVQKGTLKVGDIFVAGSEYGRVRALLNDHGHRVEAAGPAMPVEILGFQGTPLAGDDFVVVETEMRAREVAGYRQRKEREAKAAASVRGTLEQMFSKIAAGEAKELPIVVKGDVQGSIEAIAGTLEKLGSTEVKARILHSAVGAINETDVSLAKASGALIIGFNVRANPQAREMARRDGVEIRYYSIIYDVANDITKALSGMLSPTLKERFLGYAQIREVFTITKVGKVAGCMVTEGVVKRGAKVRLLRDNVVIHEGALSQLKRFKEDAKEVREGYECGMSFENYDDIKQNDMVECFEIEEIAGTL